MKEAGMERDTPSMTSRIIAWLTDGMVLPLTTVESGGVESDFMKR